MKNLVHVGDMFLMETVIGKVIRREGDDTNDSDVDWITVQDIATDETYYRYRFRFNYFKKLSEEEILRLVLES